MPPLFPKIRLQRCNMFIDNIKKNCLTLKNKTAYYCGQSRLAYGELWEKATNLAVFLKSTGSGPVVVYGHKSPYMLISFLACLISGRAYVPCDTAMPAFRIEFIVAATKANLLLASEPYESKNITVIGSEMLRQLCNTKKACPIATDDNRTAYIIFTSGSTGTPKGVPISVHNLGHFIQWVTGIPAVAAMQNGVVFNQAAFSFDLSVADIYIALVLGHTLFACTQHEQQDLALLFQRLQCSGSTLLVCTPTFLQLCLSDAAFGRALLPKLQAVFLCGEVLPAQTAQKLLGRFAGIALINAYGPTEATCAVAAVQITEAMLSGPALPAGEIQCAAVRITIMGGETALPAGAYGEIVLQGDSVSNGYLGADSPAFMGNNTYSTGDIGKIENGYLYCRGRIDEQIKYKGYRVEPREIEACMNDMKGVAGAVVLPIAGRGNKILMLAAFAQKTQDITAAGVKMQLAQRLPPYMVPKTILLLDQMPMNANGKCNKKALKEMLLGGRNGERDTAAGMRA